MMAMASSLAAAERLFSLMSAASSNQQGRRILEDQLGVALMLRFNRDLCSSEIIKLSYDSVLQFIILKP